MTDGGREVATDPADVAIIISSLFVGDVVKIPDRGLKVEVVDSGWPKLAEDSSGAEYALHTVDSTPKVRSLETGDDHEIQRMVKVESGESDTENADSEVMTDGGRVMEPATGADTDLYDRVMDALRASDLNMMDVVVTDRGDDVQIRWMSSVGDTVRRALESDGLTYRIEVGRRRAIVTGEGVVSVIADGGYDPAAFQGCDHANVSWKWTEGGAVNQRPPVVIIPGECPDCHLPVERTFRAIQNGVNQDAVDMLLRECEPEDIQERLTGEKFQATATRHRLDICPTCHATMIRHRRDDGRPPSATWACSECELELPDPWGVGDARALAAVRDADRDDQGRPIPGGVGNGA